MYQVKEREKIMDDDASLASRTAYIERGLKNV